MKKITSIFEKEPKAWGFRGDPFMWQELKAAFNDKFTTFSPDDFKKVLNDKFNNIISERGENIFSENVWFKNFPQSGMSGGIICMQWWKNTGLPLLIERYNATYQVC